VVALLVLWLVRPGPTPVTATPVSREEDASERRRAQRAVLKDPVLWSYAASYFFIKFTRYALALWLPFYLQEQLGYAVDKANNVAAAFEGGGFLGVIALGALSDRLSWGRVWLSAVGREKTYGVVLSPAAHNAPAAMCPSPPRRPRSARATAARCTLHARFSRIDPRPPRKLLQTELHFGSPTEMRPNLSPLPGSL
jgi:predicted MFS family arabinose efflux permease